MMRVFDEKQIHCPLYMHVKIVKKNKKNILFVVFRGRCFRFILPCGVTIKRISNKLRLGVTKFSQNCSVQTFGKIIENGVLGLIQDFVFVLEARGSGFSFFVSCRYLFIKSGYSHLVLFKIPSGITVELVSGSTTELVISCPDLCKLVNFVKRVCFSHKKDLYKGKGFYIKGEVPFLRKSKKEKD